MSWTVAIIVAFQPWSSVHCYIALVFAVARACGEMGIFGFRCIYIYQQVQ